MNNQSNLKTQYPLSPNKFKKKMFEKAIIFFILSVMIGAFYVIGITSMATNNLVSQHLVSVILIPLIAFAVMMGIYAVYVHYYIKLYFYEDESDFLTIKKGVITPAEIHVQYAKIQDVYVDQDILDRIFGIYDVHISSATFSSGIAAHIDGVDKYAADGLKTLLLQKIKRGSSGGFHQSQAQVASTGAVETQQAASSASAPVSFSKPISSEEYGLDTNWWIAEIVKIAVASVFMPAVISLWILGGVAGGNWKYTFWIWLGIFIIYVVYRAAYLYLWKTHYKYSFGPEYIYMKIGVIAISEKNMGYNSIQDVNIKQSIIDRIFGVADLIIENASGAMIMPVSGKGQMVANNGITVEGLRLQDAQSIANELKQIISSRSNSFNKGL